MRGPLSTNDGESALGWALAHRGVLMRSQWDAADALRAGQLVPVLPDWHLPGADIFLVFQTRHNLASKTRVLVDFLLQRFGPQRRPVEAISGAW